jgi:hypothetical protein
MIEIKENKIKELHFNFSKKYFKINVMSSHFEI